jgi:hypothetical protein
MEKETGCWWLREGELARRIVELEGFFPQLRSIFCRNAGWVDAKVAVSHAS